MAYPNTTSQSLHTLKINKVPDEVTFEQMQFDNLVNANELYLVEGDGGSGGVLWVTTSYNEQTETITADHTYTEIDTAINAGKIVIVDDGDGLIYSLTGNDSGSYAFSYFLFENGCVFQTSLILRNTNIWQIYTQNYTIPTKTSDLTNDSGFLTSAYFLVTLTITYDENDNITAVTANHTYAEIDAAFNAGKTVLVLTYHDILCLHKHLEPIEDSGSDHLSLPGYYSFQNVYTHAPYENTIYETVATVDSTNTWTINYKLLPIPTNTSDLNNDSGFLTTLDNVMIQGVNYVTAGQAAGSSLGAAATAEGSYTTASGSYSHAEGYDTTASAISSHAEGASTTASGTNSHAEGSNTTASGSYSHAEGYRTTASNLNSHAEGSYTTASGNYSHAEGYYTTANHKSLHVFGEYNVLDPSTNSASSRGNYVEIVGKGTSDSARSNARTLDWSGNEVLAGKLTVGKAPTANMDVATKKYVDDATFSGNYNDLTNKPTIHTYTAGNGIDITNDTISAKNVMYVTFTVTYNDSNDTYTVSNVSKTFSEIYTHLLNNGIAIAIDSNYSNEHYYVRWYSASSITFLSPGDALADECYLNM